MIFFTEIPKSELFLRFKIWIGQFRDWHLKCIVYTLITHAKS